MNFCVSGHENPTGAVYCVTCGKDLALEAQASGRQCTLGHPMLGHEVTCLNCGNLPAVEKTEAGISKSDPKGKGIIAKLELSDMQADARASIRKIQTKLKINLKVTALILTLAIAIPSSYFGYTAFTGPNYKGKTVEEVFKGREDQINAVLEPACSVATNEISAMESEITNTTESIAADYHNALGFGASAPAAGDVKKKIKDEVESQLKANLGDKYLKLDNASAVLTSSENSALVFCQLEASLSAIQEKSSALGQTIASIKSPGSWAPSDYYYDEKDPNMAYRFTPRSSFPSGGWALDIVSRLGCSGGGGVTIEGYFGNYTGSSGALLPNQSARVKVYTDFYYISETASNTNVSCDAVGTAPVIDTPDKPKPDKSPEEEYVEEEYVEEEYVEEEYVEEEYVEDPCYFEEQWIC
jgi:hypothetical protein